MSLRQTITKVDHHWPSKLAAALTVSSLAIVQELAKDQYNLYHNKIFFFLNANVTQLMYFNI